ncbi:hypothetical protein V1514DRAFT_330176, partial [Lipomyces japonicus]|uniref:uncharacterized protein n=1 Tax=Lipomyces japonicus TaxID=56871 RepID=UPI0034CE94A9
MAGITQTDLAQESADTALAALMSADATVDEELRKTLIRIRNMWQFSAIVQWLFMFKSTIKLEHEDISIEALEKEFLGLTKVNLISKIRLHLLQHLSSQRNLTLEMFDDYARRQYRQKLPYFKHPFGEEEIPFLFDNFSIYNQIIVIHQLCEFQTFNVERFRARTETTKEAEEIQWRVDPLGSDSEGKIYYLLDDNRLYARTDPLPSKEEETKPKARQPAKKRRKRKAYSTWRPEPRRSKRRRTQELSPEVEENGNDDEEVEEDEDLPSEDHTRDVSNAGLVDIEGLLEHSRDGESRWFCVCATYHQWKEFEVKLGKIVRDRTKKLERQLHSVLVSHVLPVIESIEQERIEHEEAKLKEIEKMRQHENRKRSSRIVSMAEHRKHEEELQLAREAAVEEKARKKAERKMKAELVKQREARLETREIKLAKKKEALEAKLALQATTDAQVVHSAVSPSPDTKSPARTTERYSSVETESRRISLRQSSRRQSGNPVTPSLTEPSNFPQNWYFDCVCGRFGENYDDGELSVCCSKCDIWLHVACLTGEELVRFEASQEAGRAKDGMEEKLEGIEAEQSQEPKLENGLQKVMAGSDHAVNGSEVKKESEINRVSKEKESIAEGKEIDEKKPSEDVEFVCNRCIRIEREQIAEAELQRKKEIERVKRRERERKREAERKKKKEEDLAVARAAAQRESELRTQVEPLNTIKLSTNQGSTTASDVSLHSTIQAPIKDTILTLDAGNHAAQVHAPHANQLFPAGLATNGPELHASARPAEQENNVSDERIQQPIDEAIRVPVVSKQVENRPEQRTGQAAPSTDDDIDLEKNDDKQTGLDILADAMAIV